jgi:2-polyprenyl-6-hydroxyphenyl methylase/3-demethylubiquinone-9 3-methyltransferase
VIAPTAAVNTYLVCAQIGKRGHTCPRSINLVASAAAAPSIDPDDVARFSAMAAEWWDPAGKFRPLHRLGPVRLAYIRDQLTGHFGRDKKSLRPFQGLRVLDVGCGGGLIAEPLARLGADVVAIDASAENIAVARTHAAESGLTIDYRQAAAEDLTAAGERFDVVLALEILEHVADRDAFVAACAALVGPRGALIAATLNRTPQSYLLAIVGAEYVLGWLPRGTHDWRKFVRPSELAAAVRRCGLELCDFAGVSYSPLADSWRIGRDLAVNYLAFIRRSEELQP